MPQFWHVTSFQTHHVSVKTRPVASSCIEKYLGLHLQDKWPEGKKVMDLKGKWGVIARTCLDQETLGVLEREMFQSTATAYEWKYPRPSSRIIVHYTSSVAVSIL